MAFRSGSRLLRLTEDNFLIIQVSLDGSLWRHWTVTVDYTGIRWWIMIVGAADHRLIAAGLPDI